MMYVRIICEMKNATPDNEALCFSAVLGGPFCVFIVRGWSVYVPAIFGDGKITIYRILRTRSVHS